MNVPLAEGRKVVPLLDHGLDGSPIASLKPLCLPLGVSVAALGNGFKPMETPEEFYINTTLETLPFQFAKLCKVMKSGQRLVQVLPDGAMVTFYYQRFIDLLASDPRNFGGIGGFWNRLMMEEQP